MRKKSILLIVLVFLLLLLFSSCSSNSFSFKGIDVFDKQKMSSADAASLTAAFNKQYSNRVETEGISTWDIPHDSSGKEEKIYGYSVEKAVIQSKDGKIGKVCFITPAYTWRDKDTTADSLQIINDCTIFVAKTTNSLPITDSEFSSSDNINRAREYIDQFLKTVMEIEKKEMKNYKSKGKAFIDGEEWKNPFVMGRLLSEEYSIIDLDRRYNECRKRLMMIVALEKEKSNLTYCWDNFYMSLNLYPTTLTIEFGYNTDLVVEKTSEGVVLKGTE